MCPRRNPPSPINYPLNLTQFNRSDITSFLATIFFIVTNKNKDEGPDTFTSKEAAIDQVINTVTLHPWHKAICLSDLSVGSISVTPFPSDDGCRAEIGCVVGSASWGKGIATQAVKMAANAVFVEWGHLERLKAVVDVENPVSQRVLEKAGFTREGVLRKYCTLQAKRCCQCLASCPLIPKSTISWMPEIF